MGMSEGRGEELSLRRVIYEWSLIFSVALGPIYWLPGVPPKYLMLLKAFLFVFFLFFSLLGIFKSRKLLFPGGSSVFLLIVAYLVFSVPGILVTGGERSFYHIQNAVQIFLFLSALGYFISHGNVHSVIIRILLVFGLLAIASFVMMVLVPNYPNPIIPGLSVSDTGFGSSRTSWSPALALYLPWFYALKFLPFGIMTIFFIFVLFGGQVVSTGRTGMLASALVLSFWSLLGRSIKIFLVATVMFTFIGFYVFQNAETLRLNQGGFEGVGQVNELSSGRVDDYLIALKAIAENPFGYGFDRLFFEGVEYYPHNMLLYISARGGLILGVIVLAIIIMPILRFGVLWRQASGYKLASVLTVLTGIVVSMLEPSFIFGGFNASIFWWLCFALCVSKRVY